MSQTATDRIVRASPKVWRRGVVLGAVALAVGLLTVACGGGGNSGSTGAGAPPAATTAQASGTKVTASLTEFHIGLSQQSFAPGTYTFAVSNDGKATHALAVTGPGVSNAATASLSPGQKANLTVTFQAGSYDLFCPVDGHKQLGMNMNVTVAVGGGGGSGSTSPTTSSGGGGGNGY